jgi:Protein of unknown function (DUF742)
MATTEERWFDADAGPVVRPYTITRGRGRPAGEPVDLIAVVAAAGRAEPDPLTLGPEHLTLLRRCQRPATVVDLAADLDLAVGVVQVLVADLRERSLVTVRNPIPPAQLPDMRILKEVVEGLKRL